MERAHSNNSTEEYLVSISHMYRVDSELPQPPSVDLFLTTTVNLTPRTQPKGDLEISSAHRLRSTLLLLMKSLEKQVI